VRRATAADSAAAAEVVRAVYAEYGFVWQADGYHADLGDVDAAYDGFWVAETDGGGVVGCVGLLLGAGSLPDADCSLERLYVLPGARGGGVGAALCAAVVEEARRHGRRRLEIWTDKRFAAAHRLYVRLGAERAGERVADDPDRSPEWGFVLPLASSRAARRA
jgi:GNAT superfamily N-acetyltransferase